MSINEIATLYVRKWVSTKLRCYMSKNEHQRNYDAICPKMSINGIAMLYVRKWVSTKLRCYMSENEHQRNYDAIIPKMSINEIAMLYVRKWASTKLRCYMSENVTINIFKHKAIQTKNNLNKTTTFATQIHTAKFFY